MRRLARKRGLRQFTVELSLPRRFEAHNGSVGYAGTLGTQQEGLECNTSGRSRRWASPSRTFLRFLPPTLRGVRHPGRPERDRETDREQDLPHDPHAPIIQGLTPVEVRDGSLAATHAAKAVASVRRAAVARTRSRTMPIRSWRHSARAEATLTLANRPKQISDQGDNPETGSDLP